MRRTVPGLIVLALCSPLAGLALAQEGNPLDRERPRPRVPDGWNGAFIDESEQMLLLMLARGDRVQGLLVDQAANGAQYEVDASVRGEALEGVVRVAGREHPFGARREGEGVVIVSGRTTTRWRRAPGFAQVEALVENLLEARRHGNEAAAIGALKVLNTAQTLFREGDKDQDGVLDYGTLEDLAGVGLIDEALASGVKQGYRFAVRVSPQAPEFLWMATATPVEPGRTGDRYFVTNHAGVIYYSTRAPFELADTCEIPPTATPVGKAEPTEVESTVQGGPAFAHVKVGQRYRFRLTNPGVPPMEMLYTVRAVHPDGVDFEITTLIDMGNGLEPVGEPTPREWRYDPGLAGEAPEAPGPEPERQRITVSGVTFECKVVTVGESVTYLTVEGEAPTFPGVVKVVTEGAVTLELIAVD